MQDARCKIKIQIAEGTVMEEKSFKKLTVWQKAYKFVLNIYKQTQRLPSSELYGLSSQIRRASVSILANIAEGSERQYKKEFMQFLSIARGSLSGDYCEDYINLCLETCNLQLAT